MYWIIYIGMTRRWIHICHIWIKYVLYIIIYMRVVSGKTHICAKYILYWIVYMKMEQISECSYETKYIHSFKFWKILTFFQKWYSICISYYCAWSAYAGLNVRYPGGRVTAMNDWFFYELKIIGRHAFFDWKACWICFLKLLNKKGLLLFVFLQMKVTLFRFYYYFLFITIVILIKFGV